MVKEYKNGTMVQNMMVNGKMINQMDMVYFTMLMVMYIKVFGKMIKQMEKEFLLVQMVQNTKEIG